MEKKDFYKVTAELKGTAINNYYVRREDDTEEEPHRYFIRSEVISPESINKQLMKDEFDAIIDNDVDRGDNDEHL